MTLENTAMLASQRGTVDAALTAAQAAVGGLSDTSTDDEVTEARQAVMDAQTALTAADALPADDPRHASVKGVYEDLGDAVTARTAHMDTEMINGLISTAQMAVDGLDQVASSGMAVSDARAAVMAVMDAIAASTALTDEQKAMLSGMVSAADTSLMAIDDFRSTADGQLQVANSAIARARVMVGLLSSTSTPEEAAAAYGALADAQAALHTATNLDENLIAKLREDLQTVRGQLTDAQTATAAVVAATTAVASVNDDSEEAGVQAARTALDNAKTALANAANLAEADRTSLQAAIDSLETSLSAIETVVAARPDPAVVAANTKAAGTKEMAIDREAKQDVADDAGLGGSVDVDVDSTYSMTIERASTGSAVVKIADTANAKDDDQKFEQKMVLGEGRTMHVRTMDANDDDEVVQEVVVVSTDIDAAKPTKFATEYPLTDDDEGVPVDDDQVAINFGDDAGLTAADDAEVLARIMAGRFSAAEGDSVIHEFNHAEEDNEDTVGVDESRDAAEVAGTYQGGEGTYKCTGDVDCTVTVNNKGELTAATDGWIFIPASGATVDVADADYLHYGFWLKRTTDEDGVLTYNEVETFAISSAVESIGSEIDTVLGSATYEGGATGVYVKNVIDSDSSIASATSGHFNADAELTAYFSGGDVAANKHNTVTGTIDNFELSGGEENAWSVSLKGKRGVGDNTFSSMPDAATGANGTFSGTFHGPTDLYDHDKDDGTMDATDEIRRQPSSVVGEFNANFGNGSVAGGFGARKPE